MSFIAGRALTTILFLSALTLAFAQKPEGSIGELAKKGHSVTAITPVYSQLVRFSYPPGFEPAYARDGGSQYIQEYVLEGETVEKWSQMVTLTGAKDLAPNPKVTPQRFVQHIAAGFQRACPSTFAAQGIGTVKISGHEAFIAIVGCGAVSGSKARSEIAVILAIKGSADYYTIQWAERAQPTGQPPALDARKWLARLKRLNPIKVCARIPGEPAPYASCMNQK